VRILLQQEEVFTLVGLGTNRRSCLMSTELFLSLSTDLLPRCCNDPGASLVPRLTMRGIAVGVKQIKLVDTLRNGERS